MQRDKYGLGKGEVVSSILTGSTSKTPYSAGFSSDPPIERSSTSGQNEAGFGAYTRGIGVESVRPSFPLAALRHLGMEAGR